MQAAGWEGDPPAAQFDVSQESEFAGWYEASASALHFDRCVLDRHKVLHELAHFLRRDGHGPQWAGALIGLVKVAFGIGAAEELVAAFDECEVEWDPAFR